METRSRSESSPQNQRAESFVDGSGSVPHYVDALVVNSVDKGRSFPTLFNEAISRSDMRNWNFKEHLSLLRELSVYTQNIQVDARLFNAMTATVKNAPEADIERKILRTAITIVNDVINLDIRHTLPQESISACLEVCLSLTRKSSLPFVALGWNYAGRILKNRRTPFDPSQLIAFLSRPSIFVPPSSHARSKTKKEFTESIHALTQACLCLRLYLSSLPPTTDLPSSLSSSSALISNLLIAFKLDSTHPILAQHSLVSLSYLVRLGGVNLTQTIIHLPDWTLINVSNTSSQTILTHRLTKIYYFDLLTVVCISLQDLAGNELVTIFRIVCKSVLDLDYVICLNGIDLILTRLDTIRIKAGNENLIDFIIGALINLIPANRASSRIYKSCIHLALHLIKNNQIQSNLDGIHRLASNLISSLDSDWCSTRLDCLSSLVHLSWSEKEWTWLSTKLILFSPQLPSALACKLADTILDRLVVGGCNQFVIASSLYVLLRLVYSYTASKDMKLAQYHLLSLNLAWEAGLDDSLVVLESFSNHFLILFGGRFNELDFSQIVGNDVYFELRRSALIFLSRHLRIVASSDLEIVSKFMCVLMEEACFGSELNQMIALDCLQMWKEWHGWLPQQVQLLNQIEISPSIVDV